jgi:hypothetical protein
VKLVEAERAMIEGLGDGVELAQEVRSVVLMVMMRFEEGTTLACGSSQVERSGVYTTPKSQPQQSFFDF